MSGNTNSNMPLVETLRVIQQSRGKEDIVVTTMGTGREWSGFEQHPLDLVYVPSSMGQATSVALGLAIAQPDRRVIVCQGDGSLLMNLGSLVTITSRMPQNLVVLLMENRVYEITGRQGTPGTAELRADGQDTDFAELARAAGFPEVLEFDDLAAWRDAASMVLSSSGPVFAVLKVEPVSGETAPRSPGPAWERATALRERLTRSSGGA
ncbi:MAG: thiamine pyrophosphate-dependent enzyme [Planctomycetota bacterium]|mgnify:CR=1 FL=1|nr:thiamine pyrophosphate-dependent enzyme [Planctomycetota bacterium]MDA1249960.1 thiamine pyrophosphate-dependent enzyme [Planctomycetota bacterium]